MPAVDIADDTYVAVSPAVLATVVGDPESWRTWWPDLHVRVTRDRGVKGVQWAISGPLVGSMEIWLEPVGAGTVLHWFLRADPSAAGSPRRLARARRRRVRGWKTNAFALKDRLEGAERVT
jgi:hypothetical protein